MFERFKEKPVGMKDIKDMKEANVERRLQPSEQEDKIMLINYPLYRLFKKAEKLCGIPPTYSKRMEKTHTIIDTEGKERKGKVLTKE